MASNNAQSTTNIVPRFAEMTPYQVYLQQVKGTSDAIRAASLGLSYFPPQLGGLSGQLLTQAEEIVLQLIDFQVGAG